VETVGDRITFRYDALGRRIFASSSTSVTRTHYDGLTAVPYERWVTITSTNVEGEAEPRFEPSSVDHLMRSQLQPLSRYLPASGEPGVSGSSADSFSGRLIVLFSDGMLIHTGTEGDMAYLAGDSMNNVRISTDESGALVRRYRYDAFGSPVADEPDLLQPYGFAGKEYVPELRQYNFGFRDYMPDLARFSTPDPLRTGVNWYTYANMDPLNTLDLWGLFPVSDLGAAYERYRQARLLAADPLQMRLTLQDSIRSSWMYQPNGGGNFGRSDCDGLTWCNQATYDYTAATSPYLFAVMTGGNDRRRYDDPSYGSGSSANDAVARLRAAAAAGLLATASSEAAARELLGLGYTVVAAATDSPKGHLAAGRPDPDAAGLVLSNVGRDVGVFDVADSFGAAGGVEYYYDPQQDLAFFDSSQALNSWR
jgi:RHS repeat-associated protein